MGEAVGDHRALRLLLERIVADRFGGAHAFLEVARLHHRLAFGSFAFAAQTPA